MTTKEFDALMEEIGLVPIPEPKGQIYKRIGFDKEVTDFGGKA